MIIKQKIGMVFVTLGIMFMCVFMGTTIVSHAATYGNLNGNITNGTTAHATLVQTTGKISYCIVRIDESSSSSYSSYSNVAGDSGTISSGNSISVSGRFSEAHVRAVGYVYKGASAYAGMYATLFSYLK